jgi:hypothetical protein
MKLAQNVYFLYNVPKGFIDPKKRRIKKNVIPAMI